MILQKDKSSEIIRKVTIDEFPQLTEAGQYAVEGFEDTVIEKINDLSELKERGLYIIEDDDIVVETKLPQVLKEKGLITSDLAKLTGISRQNINAVIRKKMKPGIDFALKTSYVLGVPVEELFTLTEEAWVKPYKVGADISVFVDVINLIVLDNRIKKALLKKDACEYVDVTTGQKLTKQEYDSLLKQYIAQNKEQQEDLVKKANPKMSPKRVKSVAVENLKREFRLKYSRIYKRLGEKIQPYVLKVVN